MHNLQATNYELTEQHLVTLRLSRRVFVHLVIIDWLQISNVWSNYYCPSASLYLQKSNTFKIKRHNVLIQTIIK